MNAPVDNTVIVAVLDSGIDEHHEALHGKVVDSKNFTDSYGYDRRGHGTHVAGVIAKEDCSILDVKVADNAGRVKSQWLARGLRWAFEQHAQIINFSLYVREDNSDVRMQVDNVQFKRCILIAAAGNDGSDIPVYPAGYRKCFSVGALKPDGSRAMLSNYGSWVDVWAMGYRVYSALPGNKYGYKSGTSLACANATRLAVRLYNEFSAVNTRRLIEHLYSMMKIYGYFNKPV